MHRAIPHIYRNVVVAALIMVAGTSLYLFPAANRAFAAQTAAAARPGRLRASSGEKKAMVIIEPQRHPRLHAVLHNFDTCMPTDWDLVIFHGASFGDYAQQCARGIERRRNVTFHRLNADTLSRQRYSKMVQSLAFWDLVPAEHILAFQTDTAACCAFHGSADDFLGIDYVGCPHSGTIGLGAAPRHWGAALHFYGNGGLSFRSKSFMQRCIRDAAPNITWASLVGNKTITSPAQLLATTALLQGRLKPAMSLPEDVFFSKCVASSANRPKAAAVLARMCTMSNFTAPSFGAHQIGGGSSLFPDEGLSGEERGAFLAYCPEARILYDSGSDAAAGGTAPS